MPPVPPATDPSTELPTASPAETEAPGHPGAGWNEAGLRAALRGSGLRLARPDRLDIRRRVCGRGFTYVDGRGRRITEPAILRRIRSLAIPPAYADVRIATDPRGHIQAIGRDAAGRIQYRYHPDWESIREEQKVGRLAALCAALPRLRRRVRRDLQRHGLSRERVTAAVVRLIDGAHIRVGSEGYVRSGQTRGAATLLKRNVLLDGDALQLNFRGKGGREFRARLRDPLLVRVVTDLQALRGARLFRYVDEAGRVRPVTSVDINAYLRECARAPVSAKDFRSLAATAAAGRRLAALDPAPNERQRRRQLAAVMREVAATLGNTPAVVRRSYVHGCMVRAFEDGRLRGMLAQCRHTGLSAAEALVAAVVAAAAGVDPEAEPGATAAADAGLLRRRGVGRGELAGDELRVQPLPGE